VRHLSKALYLAVVVIAGGRANVFNAAAHLAAKHAPNESPLGAMFMVMLLSGCIVSVMVYLYWRLWAAIQDGQTPISPATALGFLFIPFFNLYWVFAAIAGYPKEYNAFVRRHSLGVPALEPWFFIAYPSLGIASVVAMAASGETALQIWLVLLVCNYIVGIAMVSKICDAVNALAGISARH
jgi:hypothetical protein